MLFSDLQLFMLLDNLLRALDIPATPILIKKISDYFGGLDSAEWKKGSQYCTCVSSSSLSHIMLAFWWIANHTPGGNGCPAVLFPDSQAIDLIARVSARFRKSSTLTVAK